MTKANGVKRRKKKLDLAEKRRKAMVETEGGMVLEAGTRVQRRLAALELVAPGMTVCSPAVHANKWPRDAISNQFRLVHYHQVFERYPLFRQACATAGLLTGPTGETVDRLPECNGSPLVGDIKVDKGGITERLRLMQKAMVTAGITADLNELLRAPAADAPASPAVSVVSPAPMQVDSDDDDTAPMADDGVPTVVRNLDLTLSQVQSAQLGGSDDERYNEDAAAYDLDEQEKEDESFEEFSASFAPEPNPYARVYRPRRSSNPS